MDKSDQVGLIQLYVQYQLDADTVFSATSTVPRDTVGIDGLTISFGGLVHTAGWYD